MTDQTHVAIGKDSRLPQVLVDLQSYFEFAFEMDELLNHLERRPVITSDKLYPQRVMSERATFNVQIPGKG